MSSKSFFSPERVASTTRLCAFAVLGCGAMAILSEWVGLRIFERAEGYSFVIWYFVFNAAAILSTSFDVKNSPTVERSWFLSAIVVLVFQIPLFGCGAINAALAWAAFSDGISNLPWVIVLAMVGFVSFAEALKNTKDQNSDDDDGGLNPSEQIQAATYRHSRFEIVAHYASSTLVYVIYCLLLVSYFAIGTFVYYLLEAILLGANGGTAIGIIARLPNFMEAFLPLIISLPAAVVFIFVVVGGIHLVSDAYKNWRQKTPPKVLTKPDIKFVEQSVKALGDYLDGNPYPKHFAWFYHGSAILVVVIAIGVFAGGSWWLTEIFTARLIAANSVASEVWWETSGFYASAVLGVLTGLAAAFAVYQLAGNAFPKFGEWMYAKGGWITMSEKGHEEGDFLARFARMVQEGRVSTKQGFDPSLFLQSGFRAYNKLVYTITGLLFLFQMALLPFDSRVFTQVTSVGFEYSEYWTFKRHKIDFQDVRKVELRCYEYRSDGRDILKITYEPILSTRYSVNLIPSGFGRVKRIDALEKIDSALVKSRARFEKVKFRGSPKAERSAFQDDCTAELIDRFGEENGARLSAILRADT